MARVLIADDVPDNVKLLKLCLEDEGYEVVTAVNGQQALALASECVPDTILLDVMMPVLDGVEACRQLKQDERLGAIPVIMVTALDQEHDVIRGLDAGADDYITKPFNERVVAARTRAAVRRREAVAENARLMHELEQQATTDALTGLLNRRTFFAGFERELRLSCRHDTPLSVLLMDLDFFKKVNDDYGHPVGDATLRAVAAQLKREFRTTDLLCRFGGEEFGMLLPSTDEANARDSGERARTAIAEMDISAGASQIRITASFGVASRLGDCCSVDELLELADEALKVAKQTGRNRVVTNSGLTSEVPQRDAEVHSADAALMGVIARDVMTAPIACIHEHAWLDEAVQTLLDRKINSMPVTNDEGLLVGILSEKDVMVALSNGDLCERRVCDQMSANVVTFQETDSAHSIYRFLCRNAIRRIVVVEGGRPTGVISRGGLLRWIMARSLSCVRQ
jgi:diguanylate cyclase (GGDEF)-like protein